MASTVAQLIKQLTLRDPEGGFEATMFARIRARMRARARVHATIFGVGTIAGGVALTALFARLLEALSRSGFSSYLSLLFSGDHAVLKLWKELGMSLLESIPLITTIGVLLALTLVIWTSANTITNARRMNTLAAA